MFKTSQFSLVPAVEALNQPAALRRIHEAAMRLFSAHGCAAISMSELADEAGVARGTIYNHVGSLEQLFTDVATAKADAMSERIMCGLRHQHDPAYRVALAIRWYVQEAHGDPDWCRFVMKFAFSPLAMERVLFGLAAEEIRGGMVSGRFHVQSQQQNVATALVASSVMSTMYIVREGLTAWRQAGEDCAFLVLRSLGVGESEASEISTSDLPDLNHVC